MRKPFLDNLRYSIVLLVVIYHVFYMFNSVGVITNVAIPGIPALDTVLYLLYPWFMAALFVISGISARYALEKQTGKAFLKSKVRRQLIPSVAVILLIGWSSGWVTSQYNDMFGGAAVPVFVKYLVWCFSGIGPLWFLHQLLVAETVLVLLRKADRQGRLPKLGSKANMLWLLLLFLPFWGSAQILNVPLIEVYRCGIYIFSYLLGYCVFSHERIQDLLSKRAPSLLAFAAVLAVAYTATAWGKNYAQSDHLRQVLTCAYAWAAVLALLGCAKRWLNRETGFTRLMAKYSFGFYVLHYPLLALCTFWMDRYLHIPVAAMYLLLPVICALALPPLIALVRKIPVLRTLILGE